MKILISGDFCPAGKSRKLLLSSEGIHQVFSDLKSVIAKSDLAITNLECPLTNNKKAVKKIGPNLKCDPRIAESIKKTGFNMVTLANNHIYDFGQEGLAETLETLDIHRIAYTGAGLTLEEAQKTYYCDIEGKTLAIVNFAENEFNNATAVHGGSNPMDLIDRSRQIQKASKEAHKVLVIIHGGVDYYHYPSPETVKRYRFFANQGADAVVAHHTHCVGPYEVYNNVPIFYSLGNFLYDEPAHQKTWYEGYAVMLDMRDDKVVFELYPYRQFAGIDKIELLSKDSDLQKQILQLSADIKDNKKLLDEWKKFIADNSKQQFYLVTISSMPWIVYRIFRKLGLSALLNKLCRKQQLLHIRHYLSRDSHRERAIAVIDEYLRETRKVK